MLSVLEPLFEVANNITPTIFLISGNISYQITQIKYLILSKLIIFLML